MYKSLTQAFFFFDNGPVCKLQNNKFTDLLVFFHSNDYYVSTIFVLSIPL